MQTRMKITLGGIFVILSIIFGVVASELIAFANTSTSGLLGLPVMIGFYLVLAMVFGLIGFYLISEVVPDR